MPLIALIAGSALIAQVPQLSIDVSASRHPISPLIYGINNYANHGLQEAFHIPVSRWGGDNTTRYNWKIDVLNSAADYYFHNYFVGVGSEPNLPDHSSFDQFHDANLRLGTVSFGTIPIIGTTPHSAGACGYRVSKYGAQEKVDPYDTDCGNGKRPDGSQISNDPADTSIAVGPEFYQDWVRHLMSRYGAGNHGGVSIWSLDNEPEWWDAVHMDVMKTPATYDSVLEAGLKYGAAIKAVDASAQIAGPVPAGWGGYFYSKTDFLSGWHTYPYKLYDNPVDRKAHGDVEFLAWYLQQMNKFEQKNGYRLLDYLDLHAYIHPPSLDDSSKYGDAATQKLRLVSTRLLWDPAYPKVFDGSQANPDVMEPARLLLRMHDWVKNNYPGTKLAITEYAWGALSTMNGALAQADILGIFGREGLDLGTLWGPPALTDPGAFAFRIFLDYDGAGGAFGDMSVQAATTDPDSLSIFAAQRSNHDVTALVINKNQSDISTSIAFKNFAAATQAHVWRYTAADLTAIQHAADLTVSGSSVSAIFPASSITLLVIPQAQDTLAVARPLVAGVRNAASYATDAVSPGEIVTVFGSNMGPSQLAGLTLDNNGYIGSQLAGTRVFFNGIPAPLIYVSDKQVAAIVPYTGTLHPTTQMTVEYQGNASLPIEIPVTATLPAIFTNDYSGSGQGAILNQDGTRNSAANAAARGSVVVFYATGEGVTDPPSVDGRPAQAVLPKPVATCSVTIGGLSSPNISYCGAAPGFTAGLLQVNAVIPADIQPGSSVPVILQAGKASSPATVTMSIR
jgi:uncharacterized protein (TIGR03437 family)